MNIIPWDWVDQARHRFNVEWKALCPYIILSTSFASTSNSVDMPIDNMRKLK